MKNNFKLIISFILIISISTSNFAAIVSDNDGSAFVTKSEFDALKNNFQKQIDNYNTSIDTKIDGAIASYLAGVKTSTLEEMQLDSSSKYSFPLRYETYSATQKWNDPTSPWYDVSVPNFTASTVTRINVLGCVDKQGNPGWKVTNGTNGYVAFSADTVSSTPGTEQWGMHYTHPAEFSYPGRDGHMVVVTDSGTTRAVNASYAGSANSTYKVYNLQNKGKGKQTIVYDTRLLNNIYSSSSGHVKDRATNNVYTYIMTCMMEASIVSYKKITYETSIEKYWTRNCLQGIMCGMKTASYPLNKGAIYSINSFDGSGCSHNSWTNPATLINSDAVVAYEAVELGNSYGTIYGRGAYMPANKSGYWYIGPYLYIDFAKAQFTALDDCAFDLLDCKGWSLRNANFNRGCLIPTYGYLMPICIAHANASYDCTEEGNPGFSQLPSPLVAYKDSKGNDHYMDEGMFLGTIPKVASVRFNVNFQNDNTGGANTGVKLHISKKPFAYNFNANDLINYKVGNGSLSTEQTLAFGTEYLITVPNLNKDDQLYMEWIPVDSSNLPALTTFNGYMLEIAD